MTVRTADLVPAAPTGGTVAKVRQQVTTLYLEMEDGSTIELETAEPRSTVMIRDTKQAMDHAD